MEFIHDQIVLPSKTNVSEHFEFCLRLKLAELNHIEINFIFSYSHS